MGAVLSLGLRAGAWRYRTETGSRSNARKEVKAERSGTSLFGFRSSTRMAKPEGLQG